MDEKTTQFQAQAISRYDTTIDTTFDSNKQIYEAENARLREDNHTKQSELMALEFKMDNLEKEIKEKTDEIGRLESKLLEYTDLDSKYNEQIKNAIQLSVNSALEQIPNKFSNITDESKKIFVISTKSSRYAFYIITWGAAFIVLITVLMTANTVINFIIDMISKS